MIGIAACCALMTDAEINGSAVSAVLNSGLGENQLVKAH